MAPPTILCCGRRCELPSVVDLRGLLSFWLLWEMRQGPVSGAQLADRLSWRRGQSLSPGTLYPALAALTSGGLSRKKAQGRETFYALSGKGRAELRCAVDCLRAMLEDVVGQPSKPLQIRRPIP